MKEEKQKFKLGFWSWVIIIVIIGGTLFGFTSWYIGLDDEKVTVTGRIINVDLFREDYTSYEYDVLLITFDNGKSYKIINDFGEDVDFTVNSKFIMKLERHSATAYWKIVQIYRIP